MKPEHKLTVDDNFMAWFVGFVEGDGSFIVSKNKVYFDLSQHIKNIDLLYKIKKTLGFGSILTRTDNHRNVAVYYVTGKINFLRLIHLFNGNLVSTYRKNQFKVWLTTFNDQYNQQILYIESNHLIKPTFENAWLSGFIDAEGYFSARLKSCHTSKYGKNLIVQFSIAQKDVEVLIWIKQLFNINNQTNIRFDPLWQGYEFHLGNKILLKKLIKYLTVYPLKTKKHLEFLTWSKVHNIGIQKAHLTPTGLKKVIKLCARIRVN